MFAIEAEASGEELEAALKQALNAKRPVVIDCMIDVDDKVFPMVPAGGSVAEAFDEADLKKKKTR